MNRDETKQKPARDPSQAAESLAQAVFLTARKSDKEADAARDIDHKKKQAERRRLDRHLVEAAQQDKKKFNQLYAKYWQDVHNYFLRRLDNDGALAEDLSQETFFRALRYLPEFRAGEASYRTYLLRIAHNILVNYYREKKSLPLEEAAGVEDKRSGKFLDIIAQEKLWWSVEKLSDSEARVIGMKYQEGMPVREIALLLNKTENAVKLLLSRGRAKLKGLDDLK